MCALLMENEWTYFAQYSDIMTKVWGEEKHVDNVLQEVGNLQINSEYKRFTTSVLLQASCTVISDVTLKTADLLTQNCTSLTVVKNSVFLINLLSILHHPEVTLHTIM
jgi:hypothetical protein